MMETSSKAIKSRLGKTTTDNDRYTVLHEYHDHAHVTFSTEIDAEEHDGCGGKRTGPRGGVTSPFPTKLHAMLSKVEDEGMSHIVSWQPHGRCFLVHRPKEFVSHIMPTHFRQSKLTSFQRQLNLYGFARLTTGRDRGGYYHELFLRHKPSLCKKMYRTRIKGTGIKGKSSPETEPDFYKMPWVELGELSNNLIGAVKGRSVVTIEDEKERFKPTNGQKNRSRDRSSENKQIAAKKKSQKTSFDAHDPCSSPRSVLMGMPFHASVTTDASGEKIPLSAPSSMDAASNASNVIHQTAFLHIPTKIVGQRNLINLRPSFPSFNSEHTSGEGPHLGDKITFEGQHFHYLDSIPSQALLGCSFIPEKTTSASMSQRNDIAFHSRLHLTSLSESSSSIVQSLREPILSSPSSSSSLRAMIQQDESLNFNPDTIFPEKVLSEDWGLGAVIIDAGFSVLEE